jgi:EmrB/QacA subfamily drug resistance transporter
MSAPATETAGHPRRWWILGALCLTLFVVVIDNTVLSVALPSLMNGLGASTGDLQWIVSAYPLVFAGLLLTSGALSDRVGRKRWLLVGVALFGVGSAAAAFAPTVELLVGARGFMAIGGAMIMPTTLSILMQVFPQAEMPRAIATWSAIAALGVAGGPVLGGFLVEHFWWGSVFLINVPIAIASLVACSLLLPETRDPVKRRADVVGSLLSIVMMSSLVYAVIELPEQGWTAPTLVPAGIAVVAAVLFAWWEARHPEPMIDLSLLRVRRFVGSATVGLLIMFGIAGSIFVLTQHLQLNLGYTPMQAGLAIVPEAVLLMVGATIAPQIMRKLGIRGTIALGLVLCAASLFVLATAGVGDGYLPVGISMGLLGLGAGISGPPASQTLMSAIPVERAGIGSAMNSTITEVGNALGVAVLGSVLAAAYASGLPAGLPTEATKSLGATLAEAARLGGQAGAELLAVAREAFTSSMSLTVTIGAVFVLASALVGFLLLPKRLPGMEPAAPAPEDEAKEPVNA